MPSYINTSKIILAHREHPDWSATEIARHTGFSTTAVKNTAERENLTIPKGKMGRKPKRPPQPEVTP